MAIENKARLAATIISEIYEEIDQLQTTVTNLRAITQLQQEKIQQQNIELKRARASAQWYKWRVEQLIKKYEPSSSEGQGAREERKEM